MNGNHYTKIKICGITTPDDALLATSLGADYLGMIFAESPRRIDNNRGREIRTSVPDAKLVGVFMDQELDAVVESAAVCALDYLQLHGAESPEYCNEAQARTGVPIIKTFKARYAEGRSPLPGSEHLGEYHTTSYFLFDLDKRALAHKDLAQMMRSLWEAASRKRRKGFRIFLAGALNQKNVREAIEKTSAFGVDVCRGVEHSPGVKDADLVKGFIGEVKR